MYTENVQYVYTLFKLFYGGLKKLKSCKRVVDTSKP